MTSSPAVWLVLALALVAANLPFVNERLFVVGPQRAPAKPLGWRLLELLSLGAFVVLLGMGLEARIGQGLDALQAHRIAPAIGIPVLVVHDLLDDEVPWDEGERFARHLTAARLLTTLDLGHHGVLNEPAVLRDCVRFLQGEAIGDKVVSSPNLPYGLG